MRTNLHLKPLLLTAALATPGCVTTHYGDPVDASPSLAVSCTEDRRISYKKFVGIVCSLENKTDDWLEAAVESVHPTDATSTELHVSTPAELRDFVTAYRYEREKTDRNTDLVLAGLMLGGLAAALSGHSGVHTAGVATLTGAGAYTAGRGLVAETDQAQYGQLDVAKDGYGPEHLLGGPFRIPADMFVRKHLLVDLSSGGRQPRQVTLCFAGVPDCVMTPLFQGVHAHLTPDD